MSEDSQIDPTDHNNDEPLEDEQGTPTPPRQGNRPAEGAERKLPGEVFTESFQGSETAGDFLGLDLEFTSAEGAFGVSEPEPAPEPPPELGLAAAPSAEPTPVEDYDAEYDLDGPTHIMHVDDEEDEGEEYVPGEGEAFDESEDEYDDDEEDFFGEETEGGSSRKGLLVGAFAAGLVAVVGVTVVPRFLGTEEVPTEVALGVDPVAGGTQVAPTPDPELIAIPTNPEGSEPDPGLEPPDPGTETGAEPGVEAFLTTGPVEDLVPPTPNTDPGLDPEPGFVEDLLGALTAGVEPTTGGTDPMGFSTDPMNSFPDFEEGFEWVSADKLDMVWRGVDIPLEAVSAPAKTVMPRVGEVRVHTKSGEMIDGRLYAVGRNRVWLEIEGGRLGLDGDTVERFERLAVEASSSGTGPLVGARVRVNVPGGALYGRVAAQEDDNLTLITPDGAKVKVTDADVETLGTGRAVVVQR